MLEYTEIAESLVVVEVNSYVDGYSGLSGYSGYSGYTGLGYSGYTGRGNYTNVASINVQSSPSDPTKEISVWKTVKPWLRSLDRVEKEHKNVWVWETVKKWLSSLR